MFHKLLTIFLNSEQFCNIIMIFSKVNITFPIHALSSAGNTARNIKRKYTNSILYPATMFECDCNQVDLSLMLVLLCFSRFLYLGMLRLFLILVTHREARPGSHCNSTARRWSSPPLLPERYLSRVCPRCLRTWTACP